MSILLIPIAPLSRTKSRLSDCFSKEQLKEFTISMFKDLGNKLLKIDCFEEIIVYCNSSEILELAEEYNCIGIKEDSNKTFSSFDDVIKKLKNIVIKRFDDKPSIISFLDLVLLSKQNLIEINNLLLKNQLVVCPAIRSAGISIVGGNPSSLIPLCFSDTRNPSLFVLFDIARKQGIERIAIYDSFKAGFDVDIKEDCVLALEYLRILNLTETYTYGFLKKNLNHCIEKEDPTNNRSFILREI